jgi:DNA-binding XRE family transcriptional regulator
MSHNCNSKSQQKTDNCIKRKNSLDNIFQQGYPLGKRCITCNILAEVISLIKVNKLKGKIVEQELTIEKLADRMGINRSTLYRKLSKGGVDITINEAKTISRVLGLNSQEATEIFFTEEVAFDANHEGGGGVNAH